MGARLGVRVVWGSRQTIAKETQGQKKVFRGGMKKESIPVESPVLSCTYVLEGKRRSIALVGDKKRGPQALICKVGGRRHSILTGHQGKKKKGDNPKTRALTVWNIQRAKKERR